MFKSFLGKFSKDIGIDMGTSNTLVCVKGKGIVINEPSVIAINTRTDSILAMGEDALKMVGKTPAHILATRPLSQGIISDFEAVEKMLGFFIDKISQEKFGFFSRPRILSSIPLDITGVEKKAVEDAAKQAGAGEVLLVESPLAAAVGAKLPVQEATGSMIVDIGGGITQIAVISLGGIVIGKSFPVAGEELNKNIIQYAQSEWNLLLGEKSAEELKKRIGSAFPLKEALETKVRGRDAISGLPKEIIVNDSQIREAIQKSLKIILNNIKDILEMTPPELVAEIYQKGIVLCGGGALLKNIDKLISKEIKIPVHILEDPQTAVIRGVGFILENFEQLKELAVYPEEEEAKIK